MTETREDATDRWGAILDGILGRLDGETWKPAGGVDTRVEDMTPQHCKNVLRMLYRLAGLLHQGACLNFISCPEPRGDMASYFYEQEMDALFRMSPIEWIDDQPLVVALIKRSEEAMA